MKSVLEDFQQQGNSCTPTQPYTHTAILTITITITITPSGPNAISWIMKR